MCPPLGQLEKVARTSTCYKLKTPCQPNTRSNKAGRQATDRAIFYAMLMQVCASSIQHREGSHRRTRPALELQRDAKELELFVAQKFFKIDQPLPMRNAKIPAKPMLREDVVGRLVRGRTLNAVHPRPATMKPARGFDSQQRILPDTVNRRIISFVKAGTEKHDMAIYFRATLGLRLLHILDGDLAQIGNMPQIEAYGLAHEQIERHFVHGLPVGTDMAKSIDMCADMIDHGDEVRLKRHSVARHAEIVSFRALMGHVNGVHRALKQLVRRHIVFDEKRKIDDTRHEIPPLGSGLQDCTRPQLRIDDRKACVAAASSAQAKPSSADCNTTP